MGMYTGLRAKLKIKPEFHPVIELLMRDWSSAYWQVVADVFPQHKFLQDWADVGRADFIPFGALCYMPWEADDPKWEPRRFDDGIWTFQCSLKNYEDEIETFCSLVLSEIVSEVIELHSLYEEHTEPTHIEL